MAKFYGSLVGTPLQTMPPRPVDKAYAHDVNAVIVRDKLTLAAAAAGTVVSLGFIGWETVLEAAGSAVWHAGLGAGVTFSVGDVTYPGAFLAGMDGSTSLPVGLLSVNITASQMHLPLWQQLGYPDLPTAQKLGAKCELLLTTAGAAANGAVGWEFVGAERI